MDDPSVFDSITWFNEMGDTLANISSNNSLDLVFDPVSDSLSPEFICSVSVNGAEANVNQSFEVSLVCELHVDDYYYS